MLRASAPPAPSTPYYRYCARSQCSSACASCHHTRIVSQLWPHLTAKRGARPAVIEARAPAAVHTVPCTLTARSSSTLASIRTRAKPGVRLPLVVPHTRCSPSYTTHASPPSHLVPHTRLLRRCPAQGVPPRPCTSSWLCNTVLTVFCPRCCSAPLPAPAGQRPRNTATPLQQRDPTATRPPRAPRHRARTAAAHQLHCAIP